MTSLLLRVAASHRVTINGAANILDEYHGTDITAREVVKAIRIRDASWGNATAGEYWDVCIKAADGIDR